MTVRLESLRAEFQTSCDATGLLSTQKQSHGYVVGGFQKRTAAHNEGERTLLSNTLSLGVFVEQQTMRLLRRTFGRMQESMTKERES